MTAALLPQQLVLIDGSTIATFIEEAPNAPSMALVEIRGVGQIIVERKGLTPLV